MEMNPFRWQGRRLELTEAKELRWSHVGDNGRSPCQASGVRSKCLAVWHPAMAWQTTGVCCPASISMWQPSASIIQRQRVAGSSSPTSGIRRHCGRQQVSSGFCPASGIGVAGSRCPASDIWRLASGVWHLASGIWRMASGIWRLASGDGLATCRCLAMVWQVAGVWLLRFGVQQVSSVLCARCLSY